MFLSLSLGRPDVACMLSKISLNKSKTLSTAFNSAASCGKDSTPSAGFKELVPGIPEYKTLIPCQDLRSDIC